MAAVRCAARRLGGSLLQRTQAAVAEEGRLLAPSRLMRSRQLSGQVSGERSQVPERLLLETGQIMRYRQLASEHARNIQKKEDDCWAGFNETLKRLDELQKKKKPSVFQQRMISIDRALKSLVYGSFKVTVVYVAAATAFSGSGLEA
ncbi:unnamed protein product [Triticum turgidum subsp. durum]|uniref:Uncharacterized protein n=1 Tax=Triticum turgidum subsp. durum TaxID=4567 RepID=A0A9R0VF94_TRITD|nr:unnamed protein product [Triticum turgidum subsp. durum]